MLSRGNSEASARLRRAKSSASVKTRRTLSSEPCTSDPLAAKEHALAAASHAFGHAAGSDMGTRAGQGTGTHHRTSEPESPLTRSRSIRFAGPTAVPGRGLPFTMRQAPAGQGESEARRMSLYPEFRRINSSIEGDDGFTTALPSHSDYVEIHPASLPSSYRKLRKSKSMLSPRYLSTSHTNNSLKPTAAQLRGNAQSSVPTNCPRGVHAGPGFGRSFPLLHHNDHIQSSVVGGSTAQNEAVGLARDEYYRQLERQKMNGNPLIGKAAVRRHSQKTFQKTVRTSSMNSHGSPLEVSTDSSKARLERRGVSSKARDLSSSFKNRLRRVFNRSIESDATLPAQHLQATRLHFGDSTTPCAWSEGQGRSTESVDHTSVSSAQVTATLHLPHRQASPANDTYGERNNVDADDNRSRVTSWTDSTVAGTLATRQDSAPKRLSIIQENSSVPQRLGSGLPRNGAPFSGSQSRKSSLYAKLQQRMNKGISRTAILSDDILQVFPDSPMETPKARNLSSMDQAPIYPSTSATPISFSPWGAVDHAGTTMEAKAERVKDTTPKGPLRESKSTFFPQSTRIERSRTSPFRQAMRHNSLSKRTSLTNIVSPRGRGEEAAYRDAPRTRENSSARSESVYSRTSSGSSPHPCKSVIFPQGTEHCSENDATLITLENWRERSESLAEITYSSTLADSIDVDLQDSVSGKRQLLDYRDSLRDRSGSVHRKRRIGHRKEHAQIDGDDTGIGRLHLSTGMGEAPSTGSPMDLDVRSSTRQISQPMVDRFPLMSITTPSNANQGGRNLLTKPRTPTRHTSGIAKHPTTGQSNRNRENNHPRQLSKDRATFNDDTSICSEQASGRKQNNIGLPENIHDRRSLAFTTQTTHSRSSPERMARLRRMYSSHNLGSPGIQKPVEPSSQWQMEMYKRENGALHQEGLAVPNREQNTHGDRLDLVVERRNMVDAFLENRRKSQYDGGEDAVFI
ncbi:MAG: hypothetical protein LQ346_001429 [Caloplaca aetnensis]|nr:MAG: hypothetical protein LQ346_001429 [Caloplaca aetnensis]